MLREIVKIDQDKCDGCGLCATACAEGAIEIVDGKAHLVSESYCDGLGACLGECPRGAITIERRQASPFDSEAVEKHRQEAAPAPPLACGCPGTMARQTRPRSAAAAADAGGPAESELTHWPVQLRLVPPDAAFLQDADLLIVADCVPFALADFHRRFLRGKCVVIGCPKLDDAPYYANKLAGLLRTSRVRSLKVIHMEVPCCGGLVRIARAALAESGRDIPFSEVTIGVTGEVVEEAPADAKSSAQ